MATIGQKKASMIAHKESGAGSGKLNSSSFTKTGSGTYTSPTGNSVNINTKTVSPLTSAPVQNTPTNTKANISTTTISNANKINEVPKLENKFQNLSKKGMTTDNEGNMRYADGSLYQETEADTSEEDKSIEKVLKQMKTSVDESTLNQINNIEQKFAIRKQQQEAINRSTEKRMTNALLMGGVTGSGSSAQYAPISSEGIMMAQESYGVQQLAALDAEEQDLIAQARQAQAEGDYRILEKKLALVEEKRSEKIKAAADLNAEIAKQNVKMQEQQVEIDQENAIADVYSMGITDTNSAIQTLRSFGISVPAKKVADTLALLSGVGGSGIVGEYNFAVSQGYTGSFIDYQNEDANRKKSISAAGVAGDNGLNPKQTQNFLSITTKFQADPFINNAIKGQTAIAIADQVIANPSSAANQLKSLYTLVKNLDPDSAVREGEISLAEKTQSYLSKYQSKLARISKGQVISPQAALELAEATKELAQSWSTTAKRRESQYKAQAAGVGIADAFDEYVSSSDLGYNSEGGIVEDDKVAGTQVNTMTANDPSILPKVKDLTAKGYSNTKILQYLKSQGMK